MIDAERKRKVHTVGTKLQQKIRVDLELLVGRTDGRGIAALKR